MPKLLRRCRTDDLVHAADRCTNRVGDRAGRRGRRRNRTAELTRRRRHRRRATVLSVPAASVATGTAELLPVAGGDGAEPPDPDDPEGEGDDEAGGVPLYVAAPLTDTCPAGAPRAPDVDEASTAEERCPAPRGPAVVGPAERLRFR